MLGLPSGVTLSPSSCLVRDAGSVRIPACVGSFACDNRTCVNASQVCDGAPDCPHGEDELLCGELLEGNMKT